MQRDGLRADKSTWTVTVFVASIEQGLSKDDTSLLQSGLIELTEQAGDSQIQRFNDQIVATCWFGSAVCALDQARALVSTVTANRAGGRVPMTVGIATGECLLGSNSGRPVMKARSLAESASDRQIVLSISTYEVVREEALFPLGFKELGTVSIEGEIRRERVFQLTHPDLMEPIGSVYLDDSIINNCPRRFGYLVGRIEDREMILDLLKAERVVALVGPSGIGKSHLASRVAAETLDEGAEGVVWIDLDGASTPTQFRLALLESLHLKGIELDSAEEEALLLLRGRNLTVVLDGIDRCKALASNLILHLCRSSGPRFILTSSSRTNVMGENVVRLRGLPVPPSEDSLAIGDLEEYEASALFLDRARTAGRTFTSEDVGNIVEICRRLSGNPMAIVLAAKQTKEQRPGRILEHLIEVSLGFRTRRRDSSLTRSIQSSWDALDDGSRQLLTAASFLWGVWSLSDAAAVADISESDAHRYLEPLLDAGLVHELDGFREGSGYGVNGAVAEYVKESASETDLLEVRERHALHFIGLLSQLIRHQDAVEHGRHWDLLDWYRRDIAEAIGYTIVPGRNSETFVDAMVLSWTYWYQRSRTREAIALIERGLRALPDHSHANAARLLNIAGVLAMKAGDYRRSGRYYDRGLVIAKAAHHQRVFCAILGNSATLEWVLGHPEHAVSLFEVALAEMRNQQDSVLLGRTLGTSVQANIEIGDTVRAESYLEESRIILGDRVDGHERWAQRLALGQLALAKSKPEEAKGHIEESILAAREIGDVDGLARSLLWLAQAECDAKRYEASAELVGAVESIGSALESRLYPTNEERIRRISDRISLAIGSDYFRKHRLLGGIQIHFR